MEEFGYSDLLLGIGAVLIILKMIDVAGLNANDEEQNFSHMKVVKPILDQAASDEDNHVAKFFKGISKIFASSTNPYEAKLPQQIRLKIDAIKKRDRQFEVVEFIEQAMLLHADLIVGLNKKDKNLLIKICAKESLTQLAADLNQTELSERTICSYDSIEIIGVSSDPIWDYMTLRFSSQQIDYHKHGSTDQKSVLEEMVLRRRAMPKATDKWLIFNIKPNENLI